MKELLNAAKIEEYLLLKPDIFPEEGVLKVTIPRTDVKISIDGRIMEPFMGFSSWVSFQKGTKEGIEAMIMGDIVLFEDEVNTIMSIALTNNIEVTALHNHFFFETPRVFFMHIGGEGNLASILTGIKKIFDAMKQVRSAQPMPSINFKQQPAPTKNTIDGAQIEKMLNTKGQAKEGMYKVVIGREAKAGCGCTIGKSMGINTWIAFAGSNDNAIVDGDFAMLEGELQNVLKALRKANINITAIHNHMVFEKPRFIFLHYWGRGTVFDLALGIKSALEKTHTYNLEHCSCSEK